MSTARYTVLAVPGTSESYVGDERIEPVGMLSYVTRELDPAVFECENVGYPSSFGYPMSEDESMALALKNLEGMIRATPLPVILLGYSQGAEVVRQLLAQTGPAVADLVIAGAGLIADPLRNLGINEGPPLSGFGLAGQGPAWPSLMPVWELALPNDPIANAAADSLIRPVADVLRYFTVTNLAKWGAQMAHMLLTREGWQPGNYRVTPVTVELALDELANYTVRGCHTAYATQHFPGTDRTYCEHLADLITERFGGTAA